jgi:hypothetical protein
MSKLVKSDAAPAAEGGRVGREKTDVPLRRNAGPRGRHYAIFVSDSMSGSVATLAFRTTLLVEERRPIRIREERRPGIVHASAPAQGTFPRGMAQD